MKTLYWKGDLAKYTGNTKVMYGALFYEFELLEGFHKGERRFTQQSPK